MADRVPFCLSGAALFYLTGTSHASSVCYENGGYATVCSYDCCGSYPYEYCCDPDNTGLIVGCVLGGIALICIIVAVVCCIIKKKGASGRVIAPSTHPSNTNVMVVHNTGHTGHFVTQGYPNYPYGAPMHQQPLPPITQPVMPPPYMNQANQPPPPAYSYSDPTYPTGQPTMGTAPY